MLPQRLPSDAERIPVRVTIRLATWLMVPIGFAENALYLSADSATIASVMVRASSGIDVSRW